MIIEISIENYLSIKEKIVLSLDSSASKKLQQNIIEFSDKNRLLKSAVIYGANASGKSNIIRSIFFLWKMVKNSHKFNIDTKIPRSYYKLDESYSKKPSKFEIIFIHNKIKYKYGFSCDNEKIIKEYLYYWPHGRESLIFDRTKNNEFKFTEDRSQQELIKKQMTDNVLYLSRSTQLGYEKTKNAYEFIANNIVINYSPSWGEKTIDLIYKNPKLKQKVIEILQKADFGGIEDLKIEKKKGRMSTITFDNKGVSRNEEETEIYEIKFEHKNKDGKIVYFNINEESAGTQKTLSMLGPFFEILETGRTAFIDELESSLHPAITQFLVKLFNSKKNKNNAQLIFTTHDTTLLDNELFRRDQIYICSKEPNKQTKLTSFLDFNLREDSDFERAYLNGRVGGVPFIDETIFD